MSLRRAVAFSESAVSDLESVCEWYSSQSVPEVGERFVREIVERVGQLQAFPESGRVVPEFGTAWLRELIHPPFRIVYRVDETRIVVVRVWRSGRLMEEPPGV
jgi:toxin ParE1/3/4